MMNENRIRMGRADQPADEQNDLNEQGHTIVGGRPAGVARRGGRVPRAMELILKKAAVDPEFCQQLLEMRSKVGRKIGLDLDPIERQMLDGIPQPQLKAIIAGTTVPEAQKRVLATGSAAAIVALLAQLTFSPGAARAESPGDTKTKQPIGLSVREPNKQVPGRTPVVEVGAGADEPYDILSPGGSRPENLNPIGGKPRPPVTKPVEKRPASIESSMQPGSKEFLRRAVVMSELNGTTFAEGLSRLQADMRACIKWKAEREPDWNSTIGALTSGLAFDQVLRDLARQLYPEQNIEIQMQSGQVTIRVGATGGITFDSPGVEKVRSSCENVKQVAQPTRPPVEDGDEMNSSPVIRPDFPDDLKITRGIRPDLPDLVKPKRKKP